MAQVQQFDTRTFDRLEFPYDAIPRELNDEPRIVAGVNTYVTPGGKLAKRPGTAQVANAGVNNLCSRLVAVETLDSPPKVYLVGSFKNGSVWEVKYINLDDVTPTWTTLTALRSSNSSTRPHELVAYRGKVYIKSYATGEKYGTIIFNPSGGSVNVDFWGLAGPTIAARVVNPASWAATTNVHAYQVRFGWKYCYAWVSRTGQVSNRSPLETNPDVNPSDTGDLNISAGAGKCPEIVVQGHADTTRIPKINIYRTTDGGGTFYFLDQITNTGAGNITYVDKNLESGVSGGVFADPKPDSLLDYTQTAPSTVSNSPPPPVAPPKVTGTNDVEPCTPLAIYAGRIWFGIGRYLYFSAQEEIREGVPEECFPAGLRGNFFLLPHSIVNLVPSKDGLIVCCEKETKIVRGQDKETFVVDGLLPGVGQSPGHPRAVCSVDDGAVWLTHDFRVMEYFGGGVRVLSEALYNDLRDAVNAGAEIQLCRWADLSQDYLIVAAHGTTGAASKQWVLDLGRLRAPRGGPFWFTPWTIPAVCFLAARTKTTPVNQRLLGFFWNGTNGGLTQLSETHSYTLDYAWGGQGVSFTYNFDLMPVKLPAGNHVNALNTDSRTPVVDHIQLERSVFPGDRDPQVFSFYDDLWEKPYAVKPSDLPPKRKSSRGYKTCHFTDFHEVGQRLFLRITAEVPYHAEFHSLYIAFNPVGGA